MAHLGKSYVNATQFRRVFRRVELKSVGNSEAKTVLVESATQFSLEELYRTQYSLKYFFRSHIDHKTYGKTLTHMLGHEYFLPSFVNIHQAVL